MKVWLDLEDTIITSWDEGILINVQRIDAWLTQAGVDVFDIWSFAIWDDIDKQNFVTTGMKDSIERALGRTIREFLSVNEMRELVLVQDGLICHDAMDFMQINGKHWSFVKFCMAHQQGEHCILIDDAVPSMCIEVDKKRNGGIIELVNIIDL